MVRIIFGIARVIVRAIEVHLWIIYHDSWDFFYHATCLEVCWDVLKIYAKCAYLVCTLYGNVICSDSESMWISSCVKTICGVECYGGNDNHWSEGVVKYSCDGVYCLYDVTWNVFCMNHGDCDCDMCGGRIEILICCVCICPCDCDEKSIWCGACMGFQPVMMCRHIRGWYLMQTVHLYMTIFIRFKATYIWTMSCYVT